jgi:translation initiation factor 2B subunit (eIF-2B alpha/beta/delta family)
MAALLNAASEALAASNDPDRFERFAERVRRGPAALGRWGVAAFADERSDPLRIATLSASGSVSTVLLELSRQRRVHVFCAEGRPALEGRTLAADLARAGIAVTMFSDAALATALPEVDAVLVGADAVAPTWFLNKVGSRMLAAAATYEGKPFYVAATREKFVRESASHRLAVRNEAEREIWADPPAGVEVRNPYFEATSLELITAIITDGGIIGAGMVADVCAAAPDDAWLDRPRLPKNGTTRLP